MRAKGKEMPACRGTVEADLARARREKMLSLWADANSFQALVSLRKARAAGQR
jgi:hypothetical protein